MNSITAGDWTVILGGVAAILWVNWYFFFAERATTVATASADSNDAAIGGGAGDTAPSQVEITVDGGYSPSAVRVKSGRPVRLVFDRRDTSSCSDEVVFPDFGIRKFLPSGRRTVIEVTPKNPGTYEFMCGMSMLRGRLIAEE
jgi:plastocyanin domain-containing protein